MQLNFDSHEQIADHQRNRAIAGGAGSLIGGATGALIGSRLGRTPGALIGGAIGAAAGNLPGRMAADVAHDIPQRAGHTLHSTVGRLDAAGGSGVKIAAASPTIGEFLRFTEERAERQRPRGPREMDRRFEAPSWGPRASLESGEAMNSGVDLLGSPRG